MANTYYPVLCGGTFFTLLLTARKQRTGKKQQIYGSADGMAEPQMFAELMRVTQPDYNPSSSTKTAKANISDYKLCKNNGSNLAFSCPAFDNRVKKDYQATFARMATFVNRYIDTDEFQELTERLVKALLDLVESDISIGDDELFYVLESGTPTPKAQLRVLSEVCLPAFLLGFWHFAIVSRQTNTIGRETIDKWCPPNNHKPRVYRGSMGENIIRIIKISEPIIADSFCEADVEILDEIPYTEDGESFDGEDSEYQASQKSSTQTVEAGVIFISNGNNAKQIYNDGVINFGRREKDEG